MHRHDKETSEDLAAENAELRRRLEESEDLIHAIRSGGIDALVVALPQGEQVYTLQGAEHPYRVLVETMDEGAATLAADGTIVYCNKCLARMLEVPIERLMGRSLGEYVSPADYPFFADRVAECAPRCDKHGITLISASGKEVPVLFSCCGGEVDGGEGMSVILTDVSAIKEAERTILRLNRLHAVITATSHAIVHADDRDSIFREFCRVAVELGGFKLAWVGSVDSGTGAMEILSANGQTDFLSGVELCWRQKPDGSGAVSAVENGASSPCAEETLKRRAEAQGLYASASVVIKQDEQIVGALTLYAGERDFFDAAQMELLQQLGADVSLALDNLRHANLRRDAQKALQEETSARLRTMEDLREKEQLLVQQSRLAALGEMIGNIAHQWRQPLNALGLMIQQVPLYFEMGDLDKEFCDTHSQKAMKIIEHMSRTIDDFRSFFKPDKEKVFFDVQEEVRKAVTLIEDTFQAQRIAVAVEATNAPVVHGYPREFSQALLNILINARDALVEREVAAPQIAIRVGSAQHRAVVTVTDNAGGIPEEIFHKIFDPYFTTKGPQSGTGVGLYMSKAIVETNMGGSLSVSNVAGGARFTIELEEASRKRQTMQ